MAGRKKREPVTVAPGLPDTDASASVLVDAPDSHKVVTVSLVVANAGARTLFEPKTRQAIPSGGSVSIDARDREVVAENIRQINELAGAELLTIREIMG